MQKNDAVRRAIEEQGLRSAAPALRARAEELYRNHWWNHYSTLERQCHVSGRPDCADFWRRHALASLKDGISYGYAVQERKRYQRKLNRVLDGRSHRDVPARDMREPFAQPLRIAA